jgi:taurine transport system permease protein
MSNVRFYEIFPKLNGKKVAIISMTSVLIFMGLWYGLSSLNIVPPLILPSPVKVFTKLFDVIQNGYADNDLWTHIGTSLFRVFSSLAIATMFAVPLGILVSINDYIKSILDPFIEFYRPLPPLAYLPLVIIWFGIGESSKIILITLAVFAPIFLNTRAGVMAIPKERIQASLCLGASKWQVVRHIILPSAIYDILTGLRIGIGFGWTTLVAAEMVAAKSGLGYMVLTASEFLVTEVVLLGIFIIGLIAIATDVMMRVITKKVVHWH